MRLLYVFFPYKSILIPAEAKRQVRALTGCQRVPLGNSATKAPLNQSDTGYQAFSSLLDELLPTA